MTAATTEIISLYESCGLTIEQICAETGYEEEGVKAALLMGSRKYKQDVRVEKEDIADDEFKVILDAYKQVALYSEVDAVRERALRNLINEKKGRNDKVIAKEAGKINIINFNKFIINARQAKMRALNNSSSNGGEKLLENTNNNNPKDISINVEVEKVA